MCTVVLKHGHTFLDTPLRRGRSESPLLESQWAWFAMRPPRLGIEGYAGTFELSLLPLPCSTALLNSAALLQRFEARYFFSNSSELEPSEVATPLGKEFGSRTNI